MSNKTRDFSKFISDNNIFVDVDNDRVGVGTTQPNSKFQVVGVVSATSFYGDGSGLTGLSTFSGNYNDLTNKPTIPTDTGDLTNNVGFITSGALVGYATTGYVDAAVAVVGIGSTTLDGVLSYGNTSSLGMSVGVVTATKLVTQEIRPSSGAVLIAGGSLSAGTISISPSTDGNIVLAPNGNGYLVGYANTLQVGVLGDATLTTNVGDLILNTRSGTNSGSIRIYDQANGNIAIDPNGTGIVDVQGALTATGDVTGYAFNGRIGSVTGTSVNQVFYPVFVSSIQPDQYLESNSGLMYNPSTGILTATRFSGSFSGTLALDLDAQSSRKIINLTDPTNAQDSATKSYVDARTQDLADNRLVYTRNADTNETGGTNAVLNWNSDVVTSTIPDFTHSSGVFTNTSTRTRRFVFNLQCAIRAQSTAFTEADLWFSVNGTVSSTNRRGQVAYVGSTTGTILSTSWTFTMAQNDTVRCYAYANQAFTYGNTSPGSSFGNAYSALVEVQELN